jgi:hypothetical protein
MKTVVGLMFVLMLTGCSTGFNRQAVHERLADQPIEVTDAAIKAALEKKPQIRFPMRVAVHMVAETYRPSVYGEGPLPARREDWRWSVKDKEQIDKWAEPLKKAGIVSDMFAMSEMISTESDIRSIRLAAAKHGADAVLLIKGVAQIDRYVNPLAILNLFIIPAYVVPASHRDVLFMMRGAMWDVANEYLYISLDAEGEAKTMRPSLLIKDSDAVDAAKTIALEDFGREFEKRMKGLKGI